MIVLSTLLHVLLTIGKVLLILVLAVLAIILLLILAPYCYKARIKADKEHFQAEGGVSWLLFVARVRFFLKDKEKDFEVYLLGIPVMRLLRFIKGRKDSKEKKQTERAAADDSPAETAQDQNTENNGPDTLPVKESAGKLCETASEEKQEMPEIPEHPEPEPGAAEQSVRESQDSEAAEQTVRNEQDSEAAEQTVRNEQEPETTEQLNRREQKAAARRQKQDLKEQKKAARAQKREARRNAHRQKKEGRSSGKGSVFRKVQAILKKVRWGIQLIGTEMFKEALNTVTNGGFRVLKHVVPRRIRGYIRFGLNDPARTGQVCGILAMLYPKMPEKLEVIPDFQEACFEADTEFKGHVFLIYLIVQGVKIILNKNVRLLIKVVRQKVPLEKVIAAENRRSGGNKNGK